MPIDRFREGYVKGPKGLKLYYRIDGDRGPVLVCSNGIGVPMAFWQPFAQRLSRDYQVVRWDYRAHGRSDSPRDPADISIETCVDDLHALLVGLELEKAVLLGHSMGVMVGFEYWRRHPERVAALVPTLGTYKHALETFFDTRATLVAFGAFKRLVELAPSLVARGLRPLLTSGVAELFARASHIIDPRLAPHELMVPYMEHMVRLDLLSYVALAQDMQRADSTDVLPTVTVPTLVIAAEKDLFTPIRLAREMARLIPDSETLVIPGGTHAALIEQPDLLCLRIEKFIEERVYPVPRRSAFVASRPAG